MTVPAPVRSRDRIFATPLATLLANGSGVVSHAALAESLSVGAEAAAAVVSAILERELASPRGGLLPQAAIQLAGVLELTGAVPALVACLRSAAFDRELRNDLLLTFEALGAAAVEPLLAAFDAEGDVDASARLAEGILATGVKDERTLRALAGWIQAKPGRAG